MEERGGGEVRMFLMGVYTHFKVKGLQALQKGEKYYTEGEG